MKTLVLEIEIFSIPFVDEKKQFRGTEKPREIVKTSSHDHGIMM